MSREAGESPCEGPTHSLWLYETARMALRPVCSVLWKLTAEGIENVPATGGALLVSNHQSFMDPVVLGMPIKRPLSFMARSGLFRPPGFGWLIRRLGAFPIEQGRGDVAAVKEAIRRVQAGHLLVVFPEGARTPDGRLQPIQKGFGLILKRAGVPVIPAVVDGAFRAWPRHKLLPGFGQVHVRYGPPLDLTGKDAGSIAAILQDVLARMLSYGPARRPGRDRGP